MLHKTITTGINKARSVGGKAYAYGKSVVKKAKDNYGYYKLGKAVDDQEYAKLQRIKNTPENNRTQADIDYAEYHNSRGKRGKIK
jgi:hypothetical protein